MTEKVSIISAEDKYFEPWCELYRGYAKFYQVPMDEGILQTTWGWLMDPHHVLQGLLAFVDDGTRPCGFAHVRSMPSPLRGAEIGFLDDLFVDPKSRGNHVGDALFDALRDLAKQQNWSKIRWITQDHNYRARSLYDRISAKTMWNTYEMEI